VQELSYENTEKREALKLIGKRSLENRPVSYRTLTRELLVSDDAARSRLLRLWHDRLIRSVDHPPTYVEARRQGQSIRDLSFRITRRGIERLEEWKRQEEETEMFP
jgi:hypothetical protein